MQDLKNIRPSVRSGRCAPRSPPARSRVSSMKCGSGDLSGRVRGHRASASPPLRWMPSPSTRHSSQPGCIPVEDVLLCERLMPCGGQLPRSVERSGRSAHRLHGPDRSPACHATRCSGRPRSPIRALLVVKPNGRYKWISTDYCGRKSDFQLRQAEEVVLCPNTFTLVEASVSA